MAPFQELSLFKISSGVRGRSAFITQLWWIVQEWLVRPSPQFMFGWRRFWWRLFGAQIGKNVLIRPRARATYPWKISIGDYSWIGDDVELYSLDEIHIGSNVVISQKAYLCTGSHDYKKMDFPLMTKPIVIEDQVWIALGSTIMPGLTIGKGAVIGAKSFVLCNVPPMSVFAGHPAKSVGMRKEETA
ncbi:MAG: WcaF family extracellular polysaccharide biosynthesis acetyltransferase [Alphaproteobacteria bacterium]|nr:WcaF family extracellular polysaccharide biosynthesis acetyltransferase [Alphaproteobacteria bacterium]